MRSPSLEPFADRHLPDAGRLLAARHRAHRRAEPLLPVRYESPEAATAEVAALLDRPDASGAVAVRGSRVVGYLLGAPRAAPVWGPNVWVEVAGLAVEDPEVARDLYAAAAARWVAEGRTAHYAVLPSYDGPLVDAWFRLAFGHQHTFAAREVPDPDGGPAVRSHPVRAVTVRRATDEDVPVLARLDLELPAQHRQAPTFAAGEPTSLEQAAGEWREDLADAAQATFVAEREGTVVGAAMGCPVERSPGHRGLARPEQCGLLAFAAVLPHARGRGAGRALGEAVLAWSAEQGHRGVVTDWRATNLLSSRAWPALGFRTSFVRVHRLLGH